MTRTVSVIGAGKIGRQVIAFIKQTPGLTLGRVLSRSGVPDTGDAATFFTTPADIVIDAAGPDALRAFGPQALLHADLWTVGAAALADDDLRSRLLGIAKRHAHVLRLFSPWISGIACSAPDPAARLRIRVQRPGLGEGWAGPLREAVSLLPDELNSAVAAAMCGPGIDASMVELADAGSKGPHRIDATLTNTTGTFATSVEFYPQGGGPHPTAAAIAGALQMDDQTMRYG